MSGKEFGRGPVPRQKGRIDLASFRQGRVFSGRVPVLPGRESLGASNRAPAPNSIRRFSGNQRFFTHGHPAPAVRSFSEQRSQLQRSLQASRGQFGAKGGAPFTSAVRGKAGFGNDPASIRNGSRVQAFGHAGRQSPNFTQGRNGWHGFAQPNRNAVGNGARTQGNFPSTSGRNGRSFTPAPARQGGNWRVFNPSSRPSQPAQRNFSPAPAGRRGWTTFSPQQGQSRNNPPARGGVSAPVQRGGNWRTFTPSSRPPSQGGGWRGNTGRQPLNLRQPIVQRRSFGNSGPRYSQPHNFGGPAPRYNQPRNLGGSAPRYSQPRNFGGSAPRYSQPRNFGRPAYGGGNVYRGGASRGPVYQAPRPSFGGGGGYRGGGSRGGYSAPRGRAPAPSRPSGGQGGRGR